MTLLETLLDAIIRLEGDALVMHVGERPYVLTTSSSSGSFRGPLSWGQVELSSRPLTPDAVMSMVGQMLPPDQLHTLDEMGAVEHEISAPGGSGQRFVVVAARGGDDVWVEVRRKVEPVAKAVEPEPVVQPEAVAVQESGAPELAAEVDLHAERADVIERPLTEEPAQPEEVLAASPAADVFAPAAGVSSPDPLLKTHALEDPVGIEVVLDLETLETSETPEEEPEEWFALDLAAPRADAQPSQPDLPAIVVEAAASSELRAERDGAHVDEAAAAAKDAWTAELDARLAAREAELMAAAERSLSERSAALAAEAQAALAAREAAWAAEADARMAAREAELAAAAESALAEKSAAMEATAHAALAEKAAAMEATAQARLAERAAAMEATAQAVIADKAAALTAEAEAALAVREAAITAAAEAAAARAALASKEALAADAADALAAREAQVAEASAALAAREAHATETGAALARKERALAAREEALVAEAAAALAAREAALTSEAAAALAAREAALAAQAATALARREAALVAEAAAALAAREQALAAEAAAALAAREAVLAAEAAAALAAREETLAAEAAAALAAREETLAAEAAAALAAREETLAAEAAAALAAREETLAAEAAAALAAREETLAAEAAAALAARETTLAAQAAAALAAREQALTVEAARALAAREESLAAQAAAALAARERALAAQAAHALAAREEALVSEVSHSLAAREEALASAAAQALAAREEALAAEAAHALAEKEMTLAAEAAAALAAREVLIAEAAEALAARREAQAAEAAEAIAAEQRAIAADAAEALAAEEEALAAEAADAHAADEEPLLPGMRAVMRIQPKDLPAAHGSTEGLVPVLQDALQRGASTVYAVAGARPMLRVEGEITPASHAPVLASADIDRFAFEFAPRDEVAAAPTEWMSSVPGVGRVRCVSFEDESGRGLVFHLAANITSADELGLSREVQALCREADGLVVIAGPRGSGKSSLLGAFVDLINRTRADHIITIESRVRTLHERRYALISQREVDGDGDAVARAVRAALREGPDVLVVDDVRSPEAIAVALDAARAGRLVFASLPAPNSTVAIQRLIDAFAVDRRPQIRALLAGALRAVISQVLVHNKAGGRVGAREVLFNSQAVEKLILDGATAQVPIAIESGRRLGMRTQTDALVALVRDGVITASEASRHAPDRGSLTAALQHEGIDLSELERRA